MRVHTNDDEFYIQPAQIMLFKKHYWWMEVHSQFTNVYGEIFHGSVKVFLSTQEKIQNLIKFYNWMFRLIYNRKI